MSLDINLTNVQAIPIVVNANITAENNKVYHVIANATFTDPTPVEGRGYFVVVRFASSCVLGGNSYIAGETIYRIFYSGSWLNIAVRPSTYEYITNKKTTLTDNSDTFYPTQKAVKTAVDLKVDAVPGKGLSANDFTNTLKTKLDGIEAGAEVNVNADWNATSGDAQILNKPTIPATIGDMTKAVYDPNDTGIVLTASKEMVSVINKTGATITKGSIVYLKSSSSSGTYPEILLADADTEATSSKTLGAVYEDIANDATGFVVTSGEVNNLDTTAYSIGDKLWLSQTAGQVTTTPPTQPAHTVFIGTVTRSQNTNGRILYAIQNGYELGELHNVLLTSPANNDALVYESSSLLWKNKPIIPTTRTITINGTTQDLSADRTYSAINLNGQPNTANSGVSGALRYLGFSDNIVSTTETLRRTFLPNACTLKNFYIRTSGTQPATGSHVLTILKNGVATSIVITIPSGSASGIFSDTTNSESFAAGDEISIKAVNNATANTGIIVGYSIGNL